MVKVTGERHPRATHLEPPATDRRSRAVTLKVPRGLAASPLRDHAPGVDGAWLVNFYGEAMLKLAKEPLKP